MQKFLFSCILVATIMFFETGVINAKSDVSVGTETIEKQLEFVNLDIKYPKIRGLSDETFQNNLNHSIKAHVMKEKVGMMVLAREDKKLAEKQGRKFIPFELSIDYKVTNTKNILSFFIDTYKFMGGAHGITETKYYNMDLHKNQRIDLEDLFKNSDYKKIINEEIILQMKKQEANGEKVYFKPDDPYLGESAFQTITDDQTFFIEGNDLVIAFAQYQIAPGYVGQPTFRIPLSKLKDQFIGEYKDLLL
ncbi:DUF3298 and DUF4163 domain-containing protein [Aquibacillus kalidii]|uniref:DUF3298 and DUF4163 domain-containing protein n=1 Tax=Aquibacillus kalidii TaxID=2762597 RepID=UPI00164717F6|nr:DUF3298 and DUF4163 domain-containing protein [Aquibacillus kalidii]